MLKVGELSKTHVSAFLPLLLNGKPTILYLSDAFTSLDGSSPSSEIDSFSTSASGLAPPFLVAAADWAFLGGVCESMESSPNGSS